VETTVGMPEQQQQYTHSFCCCGSISDEACGWPARTVRALLAILVVLMGLGAEVAVALWLVQKDELSLAISMVGLIATEVTGVTAYYFGMSKGKSNTTPAVPTTPSRLESGGLDGPDGPDGPDGVEEN